MACKRSCKHTTEHHTCAHAHPQDSVAELLLTTENDGLRTISLKFAETVILCYSRKTSESEVKGGIAKSFSSDMVPPGHPLLDAVELEKEVCSGYLLKGALVWWWWWWCWGGGG